MAEFRITQRQEAADWVWYLVDTEGNRLLMSLLQFDTDVEAHVNVSRIMLAININTKVVIIPSDNNTDSILV